MNQEERRKYAYNLKQSGKTHSEIAVSLGCSYQRAKEFVEIHERRLRFLTSKNNFVRELARVSLPAGTIIFQTLANKFGNIHEIDPGAIAGLGPIRLLDIDGIGPKYCRHIANALESVGSIKNAKEWLDPAEQKLAHEKTDIIIRWIVQNVTANNIPMDADNSRALRYNLVQLAKYGKLYKPYNSDPDQDAEIDELCQ